PKEFEWLTNEYQYLEASRILGKNVDSSNLYKCLNKLYHNPERYPDLIKLILNQCSCNNN
ncbi:MAG TPA: hypothetical protein VJ583_07095, partial [Nitrososphaeraceae archaeon]|nr:hypothetical protein [Nitrososphaeraceae archaeon]